MDGGQWRADGDTVEELVPGVHSVCFAEATGWVAPPCFDATVVAGQTTAVEGSYTEIDIDGDGVPDARDSRPHDPLNKGPVLKLTVDGLDTTGHGHGWGDGSYYTVLAAVFDAGDGLRDRLVHARSFDADAAREIGVFLNDRLLGYLPGGNQAAGPDTLFWVRPLQLVAGVNRLEFRQMKKANNRWGVDRLGVFAPPSAFGNLVVGEGDTEHPEGFDLHFRRPGADRWGVRQSTTALP